MNFVITEYEPLGRLLFQAVFFGFLLHFLIYWWYIRKKVRK